MTRAEVEDILYLGYQARVLGRAVHLRIDPRPMVVARAMRRAADGRGDLCCPGPASPGPDLAFGATPLEFLRHRAARGGAAAPSGRTRGRGWTDLRRGLIGWEGAPGTMTQVAAGAALAFVRRGEDRAALVFEDARAVDTGGWHEGMNLAAARGVPLIVALLQREGGERPSRFAAVARAYGAEWLSTRSRSLADLFATAARARRTAAARRRPVLMALSPPGDRGTWQALDSVAKTALKEGTLSDADIASIERGAAAGVDHARARIAREPLSQPEDALAAVTTGRAPRRPWTRTDEEPGRDSADGRAPRRLDRSRPGAPASGDGAEGGALREGARAG